MVDQTTSHKWDVAVSSVVDTQIGRCRNRESFRNQQNLAKAIKEAKRFIEHSPIQSRACTPVEYDDPTSNTLLALLKTLSDDCGDLSNTGTIRTAGSNNDGRKSSVSHQLQNMLAQQQQPGRSPSPLKGISTANIQQLAESLAVLETDRTQRQSICSALSSGAPKSASGVASPDFQAILNQKGTASSQKSSPTLGDRKDAVKVIDPKPRSKTPDAKSHKKTPSNTSGASAVSEPNMPLPLQISKPSSPPPQTIQSPPPLIKITRTESSRKNSDQNEENLIEIGNGKRNFQDTCVC